MPRMRGNHLLTHGSVGFFCKCRRMGSRDAPSPALPRNSSPHPQNPPNSAKIFNRVAKVVSVQTTKVMTYHNHVV